MKVVVSIFLIFSFLGLLAQDDANLILKSGFTKITVQDYTGAIKDFNKVLRLSPKNSDAYRGRALAKLNISQSEEAMKDITKAIEANDNNADNFLIRGEIYADMKKNAEAFADFDKALSLEPRTYKAISQKALLLFQTDEEKRALELMNDAIKNYPDAAELYYGRGVLYNSKQKYEKALDDFNKCQELDPDYNAFSLAIAKGTAFMSLQEASSAQNEFSKAIELAPNNALAYSSRARVSYEQGNYAEAVEDYTKALAINPENAATCFNLGMAYYKIEDKKNACERFHKACSMGNNNACKMVYINCVQK